MSEDAGASSSATPHIDQLVLDAGPLVTQQPLRGLSKTFYLSPAVVAELRDQRARDHLAWLRTVAHVEVREPGPEAMLAVINFAKKTGDYAVLSQPDLGVLALTYALEVQRHGQWRIRSEVGGKTGQQTHTAEQQQGQPAQKGGQRRGASVMADGGRVVEEREDARAAGQGQNGKAEENGEVDGATAALAGVQLDSGKSGSGAPRTEEKATGTTEERYVSSGSQSACDSEDDEEEGGEWITPDNIAKHKSRALGLATEAEMSFQGARTQSKTSSRRRMDVTQGDDGWSTVVSKTQGGEGKVQRPLAEGKAKATKPAARQTVACMTGDYAMQNVLLQMGLSLVGVEGQRIKQVKSWVLRCHACFKLCKDSQRTFCPQCGNPTLLRTSVTSTAPDGKAGSHGVHVHLKKNFQYKNRGTKYALPLPKAGKAGGTPLAVPVLREDQAEWQRGLQQEKVQRQKEERALQKALQRGSDSLSARYEDADELSILLAGKGNKARQHGRPALGVGRRNPNEKHRRKV